MPTSKAELIENLMIFLSYSIETSIITKTFVIIETFDAVENVKKFMKNFEHEKEFA